MSVGKLSKRRHLSLTLRLSDRTARVKWTAGGRIYRRRNFTGHRDAGAFTVSIDHWHGADQRLCVRMFWVADDLLGRAAFHDFSKIHHHNALADVFDHRKVVRDEKVGDSPRLLQVLQEIDDLGLDADVQRAHRFVAHDQFWLDGERPGDANPLPLAAAELVGVTLGVYCIEANGC